MCRIDCGNIKLRVVSAPGSPVKTKAVPGGKTAREVVEHKEIQKLTGGVPAKQSPNVSNRVDPIGPKRQNLLK